MFDSSNCTIDSKHMIENGLVPDLVLLDIIMPETLLIALKIRGAEVARRLELSPSAVSKLANRARKD